MSVIDAGSLRDGTRLEARCCIVGAGPAGITIARDLAAAGISAVVLESGGSVPGGANQVLAGGERAGDDFRFDGAVLALEQVRLRGLGGSSGHWNGVCRPLDPIDLVERPEIGRAGWPIDETVLAPWYEIAHQTLELGPYEWDARRWTAARGTTPVLDGPTATSQLMRFSPPTRFATRYGPELEASTTATVVLDATVTRLHATEDRRHLREVEARSTGGVGISVVADVVVLATGGIDVPRLLLLNELANGSGLVGAGFMEHPHWRMGRIVLDVDDATRELLTSHGGGGALAGAPGWFAIAPTHDAMAERGLLHASVAIELSDREVLGSDLAAGVAEVTGDSARVEPRAVTLRSEQLAVPANRVRLGRARDPFGQRVAQVEWRLDDDTRASMSAVARLVATELGRAGIGRLQVDVGVPPEIGCHHMGTARMSEDPAAGVVDPDCRAHDVDNLYLAGSAVFPSSGWANPTLTIVALAHRLGDHLVRRLRG